MSPRSLEEDLLGWNLGGRYTLHGEIAAGGMATVHIGRMVGSAGFAKMVAIKRLHAQFARDPEFVTMFLDEARLAARVLHPNVVQPLDVIATDSEVFLVMEYVRGESLSKLQRYLRPRDRRVPMRIAGAIMVGVLHGLHAAHEATNERGERIGIVHRDVSPQNVLVGTDGVARVLDFGIAKASDRSYHTREGDLKGKLAYMSPEQLTGESDVDRRTDIYAASIVLWEMLTGRRLYDHDYPTAVAERTGPTVRVAPPSRFTQDLPPQLDDIVLRGLSRHPEERYATARDMAMDLEAIVPLATPSKVGEWVQEVAAESLEKRAARIAEIEHERAAGPVREQARDLLDGLQAKRTKEANETTRQVRGNHGSLPPQALTTQALGQGQAVQALTPAVVKTLPVSLTPPPPGAQRPGTDPSLIASGQLPAATEAMLGGLSPFDQTMALPGAPRPQGAVTASQGVRVPPVVGEPALQMRGDVPTANLHLAEEVSRSRAGTGRKTGLLLAGLIAVVVALSVIVLVLPAWIKRSYVNAAKERGIALVVEDVEISLSRIRLLRCSATVAEMPGVYLGAKSLDFSVGRSSPRELLARDVELTIDSPYAVARENLSRYLMAHPLKAESSDAALARVRVENGYVVWSRLMGDNTKLELQDVHGEVAREGNRALGDDYTMTADRISMVTPFGPIGPWSGTLVHRPTSQEITIALSAASAETPRLTYSDADPGGVVLDLKVPRSTIESLGFPKAMFGVRATDSLHVEGAMRVVMPDDARIGVDAALTLYGARANGASLPVDVQVRAKASGDPKRAVPITLGVLTYGSFRGKLWGNAWFSPDSVRVEGQWQTAPRPCATAAHVDPGANVDSLAADLEALDRAVLTPTRANQTWVGGDFEFDSRQIAKTRLRVRPLNRCGPRNFP